MRLRGVKRGCLLFLVIAIPLAWSEPISLRQKALVPATQPSLSSEMASSASVLLAMTSQRGLQKTLSLRGSEATEAISGIASWYSESDPGINLHTANGEIFDDQKLTCASWHHDFGTFLKVTNLKNGKSVVCRVNDRGPNKRLGRLIDLTLVAYRRIADPRSGLVRVAVAKISS